MKKLNWMALFLALLVVSYLLAAIQRDGLFRRHVAPAFSPGPQVEVPRREEATRAFSYDDAQIRMEREQHDQLWWRERFPTIALAGGRHYYRDGFYWYPAWGFDPVHDTYVFYGPIAAIGDLAPDEVVARVQTKLELEGYYSGPINALLEKPTRMALARFQAEHHLNVSAAVDVSTLIALGLT